jgi:hypothetical protein
MSRLSPLLLVLAAACGGASATPTAVRTDSAGVELVHNPGPDRPLDLPLTAVDTLFDPSVDTALQGEARGVMVESDAQGRLVFVDGGFSDRRVLRRETDGTIHQIGRRGAGPGEYEMVGGVSVSATGEIAIIDFSKQGFVRFDGEGNPLPVLRWSTLGTGFSRGSGYFGGGFAIQLNDYGRGSAREQTLHESELEEGPRPTQAVVLATATDTVQIAKITEPPMKMMMFESCKVGFAQPPLFFPALQWGGNPTHLAIATGVNYQIDIWQGNRLIRSIRRDYTPRPVTRAMAEQELGEGQKIVVGGGPPCTISASEIVEKQGFAEVLPAIKRLMMAGDGTLWVERWTIRGEPILRDVFDPSGAYIGTMTGDHPWPDTWLPGGDFVAVSADADSLPVVVRYGVGGPTRRE